MELILETGRNSLRPYMAMCHCQIGPMVFQSVSSSIENVSCHFDSTFPLVQLLCDGRKKLYCNKLIYITLLGILF